MKKILFVFLTALIFVSFLPVNTNAQVPLCDESNGGRDGLVPCGKEVDQNGLVCRCELAHVFVLILNVYNFLVLNIATPIAALLIVFGGVLLLVSGGSPGLASRARQILWGAAIGLLLVFGSWLMINIVLSAIGYPGFGGVPWWKPF